MNGTSFLFSKGKIHAMSLTKRPAFFMVVVIALSLILPGAFSPSSLFNSIADPNKAETVLNAEARGAGIVLLPGSQGNDKADSSFLFYLGGGLIVFALWGKRRLNGR
jgi:uncharacterized SAM-binding protein YcdF (DUF218 family)